MNSANQKKFIDNFYDRQTKKAENRVELKRDLQGNIIQKIELVEKGEPKILNNILIIHNSLDKRENEK